MIIKQYFQLARSKFYAETKKLCTDLFNNDISNIVEFIEQNFQNKLSQEHHLDDELETIFKNKIKILTINDKLYPHLLKQTESAPIILSVNGNTKLLDQNFTAVVGSRKLDTNDFQTINSIVEKINNCGFHIVSGLAYGSDIIAHIKSITFGTLAVLPCGLRHCYPNEHKIILNKIIDLGGAVISEFPFSEPPKQYNFIKRNATIVGISNAVVITRARKIKSGTMSSANFANKFHRKIYTFLFDGENDGNKYILSKLKAEQITDMENFRYSLLTNVVRNNYINLNNNDSDNQNTNTKEILFLYSKVSDMSIEKEVVNILSHTEKCLKIKPNEKNLPKLFNICKEELQVEMEGQKTIFKTLLKICCK